MMGWIGMFRFVPMMALAITAPAMAQTTLAVDNGPLVILEHSDAHAALSPLADPTWVPPREVVRMLRSTGYDVLSRPRLRGPIFSVIVVSPRGDDGRIFVDARDGRVLRFVPGYALTGRTEEEIGLAYNPPGSPSQPAVVPPRRPQIVPQAKSANRAPSATTGIARSGNPQTAAPPPARSAAVAPPATPSQTQATARPTEAKPAETKPPLVIQPTQEAPPVMGLE